MESQAPVRLPIAWLFTPLPDGVTSRAALQLPGSGGDRLTLSVIGIEESRIDAVLLWRRPAPGPFKPPVKLVERVLGGAQVYGAATVPAAIRAVEEAAIAAGWAERSG